MFICAYRVIVFNYVWMVEPFHQFDFSLYKNKNKNKNENKNENNNNNKHKCN